MVRRPADLSELAQRCCARLWEAHSGRHLDFCIQPGLTTTCDAGLLEVVLTNLLDNAVKFTKGRTPAKIEFGRMEEQGEAVFYLRDNGVGFDMDRAEHLFGAFQRLHKAREFPGTGIGLATVQRVVRRHGGRVWATSQPDRGATFYFTLG
jgi:signal transduction histidine kinase